MEFQIRPSRKEDAPELERLQEVVFPDLIPEERMRAAHFAFHTSLFPDGQWVAVVDGKIAGSTTSVLWHFDPLHPEMHRFSEVFDGGFLRTHKPGGNWLYGMDIAVFPAFRGKGIARLLYRARQGVVRTRNLAGQFTVGMLNGYAAQASSYTVEEYYEALKRGELSDPTVSVQMKIGFTLGPLMPNYLSDPTCGNAGVLLVLPAAIDV